MNTVHQMSIHGDHNIGLYSFASDRYCCSGSSVGMLAKALRVPGHEISVLGTPFVGIFCSCNSHGVVASYIAREHSTGFETVDNVLLLETDSSAVGNLITMNDHGIVVSPLLKRQTASLERFFGLPVAVSRIAGMSLVGSVCVTTNKGCFCHPRTREREIAILEKTLGVPATVGTVSFGSPFIRGGLVANTNGFIASPSTSGIELGRINEALGFMR